MTSHERKLFHTQKRRLNLNKERLTKRLKNVGPDEHYGLDEPLDEYKISKDIEDKKIAFIESFTMSEETRLKLERDTTHQANSKTWQVERRIHLTASNFGRICKMRPTTSCKNTVYDILYRHVTTKAMEYGKITENTAKNTFQKLTNLEVTSCGLFVDKDIPYLAASPGK